MSIESKHNMRDKIGVRGTTHSRRRLRVLLVITTVFAVLISGSAFSIYSDQQSWVSKVNDATIFTNYSGVDANRFRICVALALSCIALWLPLRVPLILRLSPFFWIVGEYLIWIIGSYQMVSASELPTQGYDKYYLIGANLWDIVVLLGVLGIFGFLFVNKHVFNRDEES